MTINLDSNLANRLASGMRHDGAIELPFPAPYVWALNGQSAYKSPGGALYYGGWAVKTDDLLDVAGATGRGMPAGWAQAPWTEATISSRDGDEYTILGARSIFVAPIGKRESWLVDGHRRPDYVDGARRHLQVLALLADSSEKAVYVPWGPVVLTAKGMQARNLNDAFTKWDKATSGLRRKVAPGVPAWCFYMLLGTFGKERQVVNVGKPGAQSPLTPISAYIPEKLDEAQITNLFVGQQAAQDMADYADQAEDWLNAWKQGASEAAGNGEIVEEDSYILEDEIRF